MALTEPLRSSIHLKLSSLLGQNEASAIMNELPPFDWSAVVTREHLGTKVAELRADVADLRTETRTDISRVRVDIAELRTETRTTIAELRTETVAQFADVRADMAELRADM